MARMLQLVITLPILLSMVLSSSAQNGINEDGGEYESGSQPTTSYGHTCSSYSFSSNQVFSSCNDLPYLNSFLHWSYNSSSSTLQIAYRHTGVTSSNWVCWAINPTGSGMVGSQSLVAYQQSNGKMRAYTSPVNSYSTQMQEGKLIFHVTDLSATYANNEMIIFATLGLSSIGSTTVNQVWQDGPVSGDIPQIHSTSGPNMLSKGIINFASGTVSAAGGGGSDAVTKENATQSYGHTCSSYTFSSNQVFSSCSDLPYLNSFLHWKYNSSSSTLQIAYRHTGVASSNWVCWAINPTGSGMVGSQALVAYQQSNGKMRAYTSPINSYNTQMQEGKLSFDVTAISATYANNEIIIFATLGLSSIGSSTLNQVWQDGPVSGDIPQIHSTSGPNMRSMGTINFVSGAVSAAGRSNTVTKKNIHGLINTVSWGIMMPIGALTARYLKVFKSTGPAWFYLHVSCQLIAYTVGVAGWVTGLQLGHELSGAYVHGTIGITLFCLGTLQVFALLLRPKPNHKYRFYWNIYHHSVGYTVIVLSVVNIFKGFDLLQAEMKWKNAYIVFIAALAFIGMWLEAYTWYVVLKRKRSENARKMHQGINGSDGVNGYGAGQYPGV